MKKELLILLAFLIIVPMISAVDISLSKNDYSPRETLQAQISGNFLSLRPENVFIYNKGKVHSEPVISGLTRQNNKYYYYAILPNQEGNFSLKIENARYTTSGNFTTETLSKDFTIKKVNTTYLSINPGFVVTNNDFSVKVRSLSGNSNVKAEFNSESKDISLVEDLEETVEFSLNNITSYSELKIGSYTIPIFITQKTQAEKTSINFLPSQINGTIIANKEYFFKLIIENIGESNLTNIKLNSNLNAKIEPVIINSLAINEKVVINVTIPSFKANLNGNIIADANGNYFYLPIYLITTTNQSEVKINGTSITESLSCTDLGKICLSNEICDAETTSSLEGSCCLGQCIQQKSDSLYTYIGFGLIVLILIGIYLLYVRSKKKQLKSTDDILKEKSDKFDKRMIGKDDEVRGRLDRI